MTYTTEPWPFNPYSSRGKRQPAHNTKAGFPPVGLRSLASILRGMYSVCRQPICRKTRRMHVCKGSDAGGACICRLRGRATCGTLSKARQEPYLTRRHRVCGAQHADVFTVSLCAVVPDDRVKHAQRCVGYLLWTGTHFHRVFYRTVLMCINQRIK
jgi:hypothetical protein